MSRFFQRLLKPGIGFSEAARIRKYRLSLLSSAEQVNKELKMVQKSIVGSGPDSIFEASQFLSRVEDNMTFIVTGLKSFEALYPQGAEDAGGEIVTSPTANVEEPGQAPAPPAAPSPATEPKILAAEKLCQDVMANHTHVPKTPGMTGLLNLVKKFQKAKPEHKAGLIAELAGTYNQMLSQIAVNNGIPRQNSLGETAHVIATQPAVNKADDQLQAVAQNLLGKWKHQLSPFDKTSAFRLDIYRLAAMCRTVINSFMDHLKDDLVVAELSKYADEISTHIDKMRTLMFGLNATNRGVGYQPKFLNLLERGRLSDYDIKLDKKQKEKLKKNLEQKQVSEISKMYSRK